MSYHHQMAAGKKVQYGINFFPLILHLTQCKQLEVIKSRNFCRTFTQSFTYGNHSC